MLVCLILSLLWFKIVRKLPTYQINIYTVYIAQRGNTRCQFFFVFTLAMSPPKIKI